MTFHGRHRGFSTSGYIWEHIISRWNSLFISSKQQLLIALVTFTRSTDRHKMGTRIYECIMHLLTPDDAIIINGRLLLIALQLFTSRKNRRELNENETRIVNRMKSLLVGSQEPTATLEKRAWSIHLCFVTSSLRDGSLSVLAARTDRPSPAGRDSSFLIGPSSPSLLQATVRRPDPCFAARDMNRMHSDRDKGSHSTKTAHVHVEISRYR